MKKLALGMIVTMAGCTAADPSAEIVGTTHQAVTTAPTVPTPVPRPAPRRMGPSTGGGGTQGGPGAPAPGWHALVNQPQAFFAGASLLLTDGTVMVQDVGASDWWKLTPDASGSYLNGTWTQLASLPDGYAPLYFSSTVLPDGRMLVEGGEYLNFVPTWTNLGAIYDPTLDQWTSVAPPAGWSTIGDAQSVVLADGRYMQADCCSKRSAILDPKTLTWTPIGTGKADIFDEEGWTLLPNGKVLTADANNTTSLTNSELFSPFTGVWSGAGSTIVPLADLGSDGDGSHELGPVLMRPDGTVFAAGATGNSAVYHTSTGKWTAGPSFPIIPGLGQLDVADGPSVLLPNGHVLVSASPGLFNAPLFFLEFDGTNLTQAAVPPGGVFDSSFNTTLLILPTGEIFFTDFSNDVEIYTPGTHARREWAPQIDGDCDLDDLAPGHTYRISGTQLNGLSQGMSYGDDFQQATNYPLVRITNRASGIVTYARTHDHSSGSIAPNAWSFTFFDVPATIAKGPSDLVVVANGIASEPIFVDIGDHR